MELHVGQYEKSILLRCMTMTTTQVIPRSARSLAAEQNVCLFGLKNLYSKMSVKSPKINRFTLQV